MKTAAALLAAFCAALASAAPAEEPRIAPPPDLSAEDPPFPSAAAAQPVPADDPAALLAACAARMPRDRVLLSGSVNMRRRYGVSLKEFAFSVDADFSADPPATSYTMSDPETGAVDSVLAVRDPEKGLVLSRHGGAPAPSPLDSIGGTDVTWADAGFDFVWWRAIRIAGTDEAKGRKCILLDVAPPAPDGECAFVRLWVDSEIAFVLQAAQFGADGAERRRLWVRGVKKAAGRWVFKDIEVETHGTGHRTRLHFDEVSFPDSPALR